MFRCESGLRQPWCGRRVARRQDTTYQRRHMKATRTQAHGGLAHGACDRRLVGCALAAGGLLLLHACSFAPAPSVPEPVSELPGSFMGGSVPGDHEAREWWADFDDAVLNTVIDSVLTSNFDLAEAVARVQQARAQAGIAKAALFPVIQASGSATDQNTPANAGFGEQFRKLAGGEEGALPGGFQFPDRLGFTTYSLGMDFSYEFDFWGRARNDARAAGGTVPGVRIGLPRRAHRRPGNHHHHVLRDRGPQAPDGPDPGTRRGPPGARSAGRDPLRSRTGYLPSSSTRSGRICRTRRQGYPSSRAR